MYYCQSPIDLKTKRSWWHQCFRWYCSFDLCLNLFDIPCNLRNLCLNVLVVGYNLGQWLAGKVICENISQKWKMVNFIVEFSKVNFTNTSKMK